jgi:hypothetical protein
LSAAMQYSLRLLRSHAAKVWPVPVACQAAPSRCAVPSPEPSLDPAGSLVANQCGRVLPARLANSAAMRGGRVSRNCIGVSNGSIGARV